MAQVKSKMTPLALWEWILILSPIAVTILAYVALTSPPLEEKAMSLVAPILDGMCAGGVPAFWCRVPKPVTMLTAVQFLSFLWFVAVSVYLFWRVRFGPYVKPLNYVPGAASFFEMASWGVIWFFMLIGGQIFPYRGTPLAEPSLLFSMLGLSLALMSLRMLAISLRFRH